MKCLTVRQPWAHLIIAGIKKVENRGWGTNFRGRLAVHAAARLDVKSWSDVFQIDGPPVAADEEVSLDGDGAVLPALCDLPLGAIVGTVEVTGCLAYDDLPRKLRKDGFASGPFCWLLADPRPLAKAVKCKGALGLWEAPKGVRLKAVCGPGDQGEPVITVMLPDED